MAAKPGTRPPNAGKGRVAGVPNKLTTAIKTGVLNVYNGLGGDAAMQKWAKRNPTEYYKIAARLIPHEVIGPGENGEHLIKTIVHEHAGAQPGYQTPQVIDTKALTESSAEATYSSLSDPATLPE